MSAPAKSHWSSRLSVAARLFLFARPLEGAAGRGLPAWEELCAEGGAVWRKKQARPGGGSPGRTMDSQGRKVVVCDNGTGVRPPRDGRVCVWGARGLWAAGAREGTRARERFLGGAGRP